MPKIGNHSPNDTVLVVGHGEYKFGNIDGSVVAIGGKYYFRHDTERVVRLKDSAGLFRYFRINSPLIFKNEYGEYIFKSNAVQTEDGLWIDPKSDNVVKLDGKYYRKKYCVKINMQWYLITDPRIFKDEMLGIYALLEDLIKLSPKFYSSTRNKVCKHNHVTITDPEGNLILKQDSCGFLDGHSGEMVYYHHNHEIWNSSFFEVLLEFQDKTNPQIDRLRTVKARECDRKYFTSVTACDQLNGTPVLKTKLEYFNKQINDYILPRLISESEKIKASINANFSDLDSTENTAKTFKIINKPFAGKQTLRMSPEYGIPIKSLKHGKTGGIKYSFGIEIETSQGMLPSPIIDALGVLGVGDRSIGAGEYVTSPLTGDRGLKNIEELCGELAKHTLVDDRCAVHIHVGGLTDKTAPDFNRDFLINSIKLGCYLEKEIYQSMPPSRTPTLYHCHSIKRYQDINKNNYNDYMGAYIFGPKEWWLPPTNECPHPLFNFKEYSLSSKRNANTRIETWQRGRYKWLNLINCFSNTTEHKTIEFRIFSPTTNFKKVYAYLMLSLAFTKIVDTNPGIITPDITLNKLFDCAYNRYPEICSWLKEFYQQRKEKFNRTEIYPNLPLDFLTK